MEESRVEIRGPRVCGKTETLRRAVEAVGGSQIKLDVSGIQVDLLRSAPVRPSLELDMRL
ncbi:hypothetical protein [Actinomyces mediterranea]|uniref:hypothetical protein n=1 Tax=Actinomyces mediterranea TaxID=1871028 RepID=UPI000970A245|nr:hypothetical protein [Actinomyces mediterranea]